MIATLRGSDASFDDCQASVLIDGSESMLDATPSAPALETLRNELPALVGVQVPRPVAKPPENSVQEYPNCLGGRLTTKGREPHHPARVVIDGNPNPPTERPEVRQGEGNPRDPETESLGHDGQIHVPEVIRLPNRDHARDYLRSVARSRPSRVFQHPAHGSRAEVESRASKNLCDLDPPHRGAKNLEAPQEIADEVRKPVHGLGQAEERVRSFLVEAPHPGGDGERGHEESPGRLGRRPATLCMKLENCQSRRGWIMGTFLGVDLLPAGILDAAFFSQQENLLLQAVGFGLAPELGVHAIGGPASGQRQKSAGKGDDLDDRRADTTGPGAGQGKEARRWDAGHGQPPAGIQP
jgi:hypothetical protein